jgi:uncharacterized membrane protein
LITNEAATSLGGIPEAEQRLLADLRRLRRSIRWETVGEDAPALRLTPGQRVADAVASVMGSWTFIIAQTVIACVGRGERCRCKQRLGSVPVHPPEPRFVVSVCYAVPVIMKSQNRQQDIDRKAVENDCKVNVKAELEIEPLHEKIDELRTWRCLSSSRRSDA